MTALVSLRFRPYAREGYGRQTGRAWRSREGWHLEAEFADGRRAQAEAAPLPGRSREAFADVEQALAVLRPPLTAPPQTGLASLDFALWSLFELDEKRASVEVNGLVDDLFALDLDAQIAALRAQGVVVLKCKVGAPGRAEEERARLRDVGGLLRLDANRGLPAHEDPDAWCGLPIELFEEPAPWPAPLVWASRLPIGLDESLEELSPSDALRPASAVVLKPGLLGLDTLAWADWGRATGRRVIITHAYETEVGMRALVRLAARLAPQEVHGLAPHRFCTQDALRVEAGRVAA